MTPIEDELRTTLRERVRSLPAPADPLAGAERRAARIHRNRVTSAVAATALVVAAVAIGVPRGFDAIRSGAGPAGGYTGGGSPLPSPPTGAPPTDLLSPPPPLPDNLLDWPARGQAPSGAFERSIVGTWTAEHAVERLQTVVTRLWSARLPEGGEAAIWQLWTHDGSGAHTVVGQRLAGGRTFIISDTVTPRGVRAVSSILQGGAFPHVVVLGPPKSGQILYAADGTRMLPVEALPGFIGGDGWAVFDRTGPAIGQQLPDLIEVLDGDGRSIFRGPIDVGPSAPDV